MLTGVNAAMGGVSEARDKVIGLVETVTANLIGRSDELSSEIRREVDIQSQPKDAKD